MAGKPSTQFYPGDWWRSVDLRKCSMTVQGIWFNMLIVMWDEIEQGKIAGTRGEICRLIGCEKEELETFFSATKLHKFATVTFRNRKVTIINRRMYKSYNDRIGSKTRVRRHREKKKSKSNSDVTPPSSTSTSSSLKHNNNNHVTNNVTSSSKKESISPSLQEVLEIAPLLGMPEDKAKAWYEHYQPQGFIYGSGLPITELRGALVRWKNNRYRYGKNCSNKDNDRTKDAKHQTQRTNTDRDYRQQESQYGQTIDV